MTKTESVSAISKSKLALLPSESAEEFASLRAHLIGEIKPRGAIEEIYVGEVAHFVWETIRLRRIRVGIIQNAIPAALRAILDQLFVDPENSDSERRFISRQKAQWAHKDLSVVWLYDPEARNKVEKRLGKFGLDENAIEAEAFRMFCTDLERVEKMLAIAESGRDRALRFIAEYRKDLALQVRRSVDRMLETDDGLPVLPPDESPATA
jgi:hypothetical protein